MSYENVINAISLPASADLSSHQYKFVKMTSTGVALQDTVGAKCIGVLQNKPSAVGQAARIAIAGSVTKMVVNGAVAIGADVGSTSAGTATTVSASGNVAMGVALEAATAAGDIIAVLLDSSGELN